MNFEKSAKTYRENAIVQREMAKKLASFLGKKYGRILEIGAGTGFLTDEIVKNVAYEELILNDIEKNQTGVESCRYLQGDIQTLELPKKLDLIISNAAFQWIEDLPRLFRRLKNASKEGATLAFTTFGVKNFEQIKVLGKSGLNYPTLYELQQALCDWEILHLEEEVKTLYFGTVREVLKHIKSTGVTRFEGGLWTMSRLKEFEGKYARTFSDKNGVELSYHPIYCLARKRSL